jgi:hypothetical protein
VSDGAEEENTSSNTATSENNDAMILAALARLEDSKSRGKMKVTVASIESITGLARSTIRNRAWAVSRLKLIKVTLKEHSREQSEVSRAVESEGSILEGLQERMRNAMKQNARLYEEVLSLRRILERKDSEIRVLKGRKF